MIWFVFEKNDFGARFKKKVDQEKGSGTVRSDQQKIAPVA